MYSKKLKFNSDGKFKIMQIADIQEEVNVSPDTLRLLTLATEREKPDLIVLTGDQIHGISPSYFTGNAEQKVRKVIDTIVSPFVEAGIPFAVTFGNHDRQAGLSNAEQADIYNSYEYCISGEAASDTDKGTFRLPVYSDDRHIFDIYLIDSNGQSVSGGYMPVSEEQLEWFRAEREKAMENGEYTRGIVFQHIPVPEYYNVLKKVKFGTKGAVEAFRTHKGEFYTLPGEIKNKGGFMGESPAVPDRNSGEFDVLLEKGNILALTVGHDHINSFATDCKGMKLIYTQCAGFNVYGPHLKRGVRIIELDKNDLSAFNTYTLTYEELTDEKLSAPLKEFILTHIPTSMEQVKRLALLGIAGMGTVGSAVLYYYLKKHK